MNYLGLCAIAKDEDPFLREWVLHHYMLGVERFIFYDNESACPIAEILKDFIAAGFVQVFPIAGKSRQRSAYTDCLRRFHKDFHWLGFLDVDEFIILNKHKDLRLLLSEYPEASGLALHWRIFGSSGHLGRPAGLVLENYNEYLDDDQARLHVKCLVRPDQVSRVVDPHTFEFYNCGYCVDENGFPILNAIGPYTGNVALVHHYMYKSQQDYEAKTLKGRSDAYELSASRKPDKFVRQSTAPTQKFHMPAAHLKALKSALKTGIPVRYVEVDTSRFYGRPLHRLVDDLQELLRQGRTDQAEVLMSSQRHLYADTPEFLHLDFLVALSGGRLPAAEKRLLRLISREPALEFYYQLYLLWKNNRKRKEARALKEFILMAGSMFEAGAHEVIRKLNQEDELG